MVRWDAGKRTLGGRRVVRRVDRKRDQARRIAEVRAALVVRPTQVGKATHSRADSRVRFIIEFTVGLFNKLCSEPSVSGTCSCTGRIATSAAALRPEVIPA